MYSRTHAINSGRGISGPHQPQATRGRGNPASDFMDAQRGRGSSRWGRPLRTLTAESPSSDLILWLRDANLGQLQSLTRPSLTVGEARQLNACLLVEHLLPASSDETMSPDGVSLNLQFLLQKHTELLSSSKSKDPKQENCSICMIQQAAANLLRKTLDPRSPH